MLLTGIIALITCISMILCVLIKPNVRIKNLNLGLYWIIALIGATMILICNLLSLKELGNKLLESSAINPIKILCLFISVTFLSIYLDEVGFFKYIANLTLKKAKTSQKMLFVYLYVVVSILTIFTSNDIVILTFTPFICYFAKNAKINPVPYLISEFVAANTWSMLLIIGNPTNIYLATSANIDFISYFKVMALPASLAGICAFLVLYFLFKKSLSIPFQSSITEVKLPQKPLAIIGLVNLSLSTILLAISSFINIEMWLITLFFAILLFVEVLIYKLIKKENPTELFKALKRSPWELIPFVLSMFVIVLALDKHGLTNFIASKLGTGSLTIVKYGIASTIGANLINNIPLSVLFSAIDLTLPIEFLNRGIYASIIGSNIGAFLTPVGALAGIMWANILKENDFKFPFYKFVCYGTLVAIPTLAFSLAGLYLTSV